MANEFLRRYSAQEGRLMRGFTPAAEELLKRFDWPGNVRQLQNEIQRAVLLCGNAFVDVTDLTIVPKVIPPTVGELSVLESMERNAIAQMLQETQGNKVEAAQRLGLGARPCITN